MWVPHGEEGHIPMGGLDGDATACQLIKEGYVDATGVQDLYFEAESALTAILAAVEAGEAQPNQVIADPGFALAHAARAHAALRDGDAAAAKRSLATAEALSPGLPEREARHLRYFSLFLTGQAEAALAALVASRSLKDAALDGDVARGKVEAGQSAGLIADIPPAGELLLRLAEEAEAVRLRLAAGMAQHPARASAA